MEINEIISEEYVFWKDNCGLNYGEGQHLSVNKIKGPEEENKELLL